MARKKPPARDEIIEEARERYARAQEEWGPIYEKCRDDRLFSDPTDPQQWPEDAKRERTAAKRPCLTFDQTNQFVRQVINTARRNKPAMTFLPVDDQSDPKLADVLKGLAKQTEYASRADVSYITALEHATRGGIGWFRLVLEDEPGSEVDGQQCARIMRIIDPECVLVDPDFTEPDGSDMKWGFVEETITKKEFERRYPGKTASDWDDKGWFTKDHVRICDYYRVQKTDSGTVVEGFKISGEEVLDQAPFPAEHVPLFPVIGNESWDKGKRRLSGCVRLARDAQMTYNLERNAGYESVSLQPKAPYLTPLESIAGLEAFWKQANTGNLPYLPFNTVDEQGNPLPFKPERVAPPTLSPGWGDLAERSRQDIQAALGMFNASIGNNPNDQSGRAVLALQDKADVGTFHYVDNLALSIAHCGLVLTQVWPVIYDQKQVLRIIGEDDDPQFVTVDPNMPHGYTEQQGLDGQTRISINPGVGRYDVRAVVGPAFQTRQQEAAAELGDIVNGNPQMMALLGDVWLKLKNFPDSDKLARRLQAMLPPQVQAAEGKGQQIPPEVQQVLQNAQQEIQQLHQALQEAQSGMQAAQLSANTAIQTAQINAASRERIAAGQNDVKHDVAELTGLVQLLLQKMQPPPLLAADVDKDLSQEGASQ